jgi:uncharacterized protein (TIGR03118 family)
MTIRSGLAICFALLAFPVLASTTKYKVTPLVSDQAGVAAVQDTDLVNPWGLAQANDSAPVWVSDNGTDKSTLYSRTSGTKNPLVVAIPGGAPTGIVFATAAAGFTITENGISGPASFIYDSEAGLIEGWNSSVDQNNAVVAFDGSVDGSVYKGLAVDLTSNRLYAADFTNDQVELFNNSFVKTGSFTDHSLPNGYAPFNVALLNGKLYVAFAKRKRGSVDEIDKPGFGYVDVFDTNGNLLQNLIANGPLNAPWGLAIAPSGFGTFAGALLVGNFGDGRINAFDATTGAMLGTLMKTSRKALKIDGLWALDVGPGSSTVSFSAGPGGEAHGLLGTITPK